ncbi:MAG TPA: carboxylesterase family protein [Gemmatimonadales bacterium]|jgi:carboxylesterase type B
MTTLEGRLTGSLPAPTAAVVDTSAGSIRGLYADGVTVFRGVPYAAPPVGLHRLRPPAPVAPWSGIRAATEWGPKPPQLPYPPPFDALIPERGPLGDDCLNLNIWTPDRGSAGLPVMVWIPGGMFEAGSGATYDGSRFARDGVVCLTINYRTAAEGFLYCGDEIANLGLLDQIAALQWVQQNIAAFGGDPGNVTVFGQSAGGMSVGTLLSMPRARGLFRRAIAQSGGAHQVISPDGARTVARRLAGKLGITASREAFATAPVERLLQAQAELKADLVRHPDPERWGIEAVVSLMPWQPVIDGDVVPARPIDRIVAGAGRDIDLMVGATTEEFRFFLVPNGAIDRVTPEALAAVIRAYGLPVEAALACYRASASSAAAGDLLAAVQSDWYFRIPVLRLADAHATGPARTYRYEFAWRSSLYGGRLGACHGADIGFVFDTLGTGTEALEGDDPPAELARTMHAAWVGFARNGDPGWPKYDRTRRSTMRFDTTSAVVYDPQSRERVLWEGVR